MLFCRIVFVAWLFLALGISMAEHGKPRTGYTSFWTALISSALQLLLLWGGGFFG